MAQGAQSQQLKFDLGPLGPQLMAQVSNAKVTDDVEAKFESFHVQTPAFPFNTFVQQERSHWHKGNSDMHACASTVMAMDISREMFLVGDIFMRKFYTIFDRDNDRVGIAKAVQASTAKLSAVGLKDLHRRKN